MGLDLLYRPVEHADAWLAELLAGAPPLVALALAVVLGLRHASDPDHLVAVTSLVAAEDDGSRAAVRLGAWWGVGHSLMLLAIGLPLIALDSRLPGWLESGAEAGVGAVIVVLAARVCAKWVRGDYRAGPHRHASGSGEAGHRHLRATGSGPHGHHQLRSPRQALAIGLLHGLAGTGAVVLLLVAALPTRGEAAMALAVFAPMSIVSMAALTGAWAWALTRPALDSVYRGGLIPALGLLGVVFGLSYVGLG